MDTSSGPKVDVSKQTQTVENSGLKMGSAYLATRDLFSAHFQNAQWRLLKAQEGTVTNIVMDNV